MTAYLCPAGVWTIGWGHTEGVHPWKTISEAVADELLEEDVTNVEDDLAAALPIGMVLTQGQWDALVSLSFNLAGGARALPRRAPKLWAHLCAGEMPQAAHEFLDLDHALVNGESVELPGLKARREAEAAMFMGA